MFTNYKPPMGGNMGGGYTNAKPAYPGSRPAQRPNFGVANGMRPPMTNWKPPYHPPQTGGGLPPFNPGMGVEPPGAYGLPQGFQMGQQQGAGMPGQNGFYNGPLGMYRG